MTDDQRPLTREEALELSEAWLESARDWNLDDLPAAAAVRDVLVGVGYALQALALPPQKFGTPLTPENVDPSRVRYAPGPDGPGQ